jgi:hypothetical protein
MVVVSNVVSNVSEYIEIEFGFGFDETLRNHNLNTCLLVIVTLTKYVGAFMINSYQLSFKNRHHNLG